MKKFLALILAACSVLCAPERESLAQLTSYVADGTYEVYAAGHARSEYAVRFDNGGDTVLRSKLSAARYVYDDVACVLGETVAFEGGQAELDRLISVLEFVLVERGEIEGCYYGYAARLGTGVVVRGKEINCQIVTAGDRITVGYPLIMGSYHLNT